MTRIMMGLAVVASCVLAADAQTAQTPALPSVDQILAKSVEAMGGRAALEKLTSITARGTISIPDQGINGTIQLFQKAPDKALTIVEIQGAQQREGFDGTIAWADDPQNGLREKNGLELAEARRGATFSRELKMKSLYPTMTVKGRQKVGAGEAYLIEATPAEGAPMRMFFDVQTGLQVRQIVTRQTPAGPLEVDVSFEDFRPVDGVKRPFTIRQATSMFSAVIQLAEIKHNVAIDDKMFSKPASQ